MGVPPRSRPGPDLAVLWARGRRQASKSSTTFGVSGTDWGRSGVSYAGWDNAINARRQQVQILAARGSQATAWFNPEVLAIPLETVRQWMSADAKLAVYRFAQKKTHLRGQRLGFAGQRSDGQHRAFEGNRGLAQQQRARGPFKAHHGEVPVGAGVVDHDAERAPMHGLELLEGGAHVGLA